MTHALRTLIRKEMRRRGITQQHLADALGLSCSSVSRRLSGESRTTVDEASAIAALLGLDLADLLERAEAAA